MSPGRRLGLVGLCGAVGGAINAGLCYAKFPVPVGTSLVKFSWHIIPAGAVHGALLAMIPVGFARSFRHHAWPLRWAAVPVVGWLCGWLPFIPVNWSIHTETSFLHSHDTLLQSLFWPFQSDFSEMVLGLWQFFGAVGMLYYAGLSFLRLPGLKGHLALAIASGVLGSFWWWDGMDPWYFSLLHGAIWGAPVGYGFWTTRLLSDA